MNIFKIIYSSRKMYSHENDNWKKNLSLPEKDTRPQTEVRIKNRDGVKEKRRTD